MRKLFTSLAFILAFSIAGRTQGLLPTAQQWSTNTGVPLAGGKICTNASGTSANLTSYPTYADAVAGTNANANPVVLDSAGRANIWLKGGSAYRIIIYAATVGTVVCTSPPAGAISTVDGVTTGVSVINAITINGVQMCDQYPGSDAGAKITACMAALPTTGGTANALGIQGTQASSATITISKPVKLLIGAMTLSCTGTTRCINITSAGASIEGLTTGSSIITPTSNVYILDISASNVTVRNLDIRGRNIVNTGATCINAGSASYVTIENNLIELCGSYGVNAGGSSPYWIISGNRFSAPLIGGILYANSHGLIQKNIFLGTGSNAIDVGDGSWNDISGNQIYNSGTSATYTASDCGGILVAAVNVSVRFNNIVGNIVDASKCQGIALKPSTGLVVEYNVVAHNTVTNSSSAIGDGISLDGSGAGTIRYNTVDGNTATGNIRYGIAVDGTVATVADNSLMGNMSLANGTQILNTGTRTRMTCNVETIADDSCFIRNFVQITGSNAGLAIGTTPAGTGIIRIPNNQYIYGKTAAGTDRLITGIDSSNQTIVRGAAGTKTVLIQNSSGTEMLSATESGTWTIPGPGALTFGGVVFANLPAAANGTIIYCADCGHTTSPCANGGGGAIAKRLGGAWYCN